MTKDIDGYLNCGSNNLGSISYIIPAFNCVATLAESVESIFKGNFVDGDEIIIVDDGSTDGTPSLIEALSKRYSGIKYKIHPKNLGGASARNTAVSMAASKWVFCLDSDNKLMPNSVRELLSFALINSYDIAAFKNVLYFKGTNTITHKWVYPSGQISLADALSGPISPCASGNYLFTTKSWEEAGGYETTSGALDAWTFGIKQLAVGSSMGVIPRGGYLHRYGHNSYWIREGMAEVTTKSATQALLKFSHLLSDESISLLKTSKNWFSQFDTNSISLRDGEVCKTGYPSFNLFTKQGIKLGLVYILNHPQRINFNMFF